MEYTDVGKKTLYEIKQLVMNAAAAAKEEEETVYYSPSSVLFPPSYHSRWLLGKMDEHLEQMDRQCQNYIALYTTDDQIWSWS